MMKHAVTLINPHTVLSRDLQYVVFQRVDTCFDEMQILKVRGMNLAVNFRLLVAAHLSTVLKRQYQVLLHALIFKLPIVHKLTILS